MCVKRQKLEPMLSRVKIFKKIASTDLQKLTTIVNLAEKAIFLQKLLNDIFCRFSATVVHTSF